MNTYRVVVVRADSPGFTGASGVYSTMAEAKAELLDIARTWVGLIAPELHADGSITVTPDGMPSRTYSVLTERMSTDEPHVTETDVLDSEREQLSQWFACEECGQSTEVIDARPGETLCFPCWQRLGEGAD